MNLTETKQLLAVIAARYPASKVWDQDPELTIKAWQMTLDDISLGDAQRVLVTWFKANKWAPDPSEIRALMAEAVNPLPSEGEVYALRNRYIRGGDLDPFSERVYRSIGTPRDVGLMPVEGKGNLREVLGFAYRRMAGEERTERTAHVGELAAGGLRAIS